MSRTKIRSGQNFGSSQAELFKLAKTDGAKLDGGENKPVVVKIVSETEIFGMIWIAADHFSIKPTKAARILIRAGYLALVASIKRGEV